MIGGSRQSVNRLLADLTDQGLVRLERDQLVVVDVERLAADGRAVTAGDDGRRRGARPCAGADGLA